MDETATPLQIDPAELQFEFIRSAGPGGQNVNKVATAVQLRWDVNNSHALVTDVKDRLMHLAGSRMTDSGVLIIEARRYRTQEQNRADAVRRLAVLIAKALEKPKVRKKTKPGITAKAARVASKKKRGELKRIRRYDPDEWE